MDARHNADGSTASRRHRRQKGQRRVMLPENSECLRGGKTNQDTAFQRVALGANVYKVLQFCVPIGHCGILMTF